MQERRNGMEDNGMSVFKSYLRRLLHDLKELEQAQREGNKEKAEELLKNLIEDTQKGIEDN